MRMGLVRPVSSNISCKQQELDRCITLKNIAILLHKIREGDEFTHIPNKLHQIAFVGRRMFSMTFVKVWKQSQCSIIQRFPLFGDNHPSTPTLIPVENHTKPFPPQMVWPVLSLDVVKLSFDGYLAEEMAQIHPCLHNRAIKEKKKISASCKGQNQNVIFIWSIKKIFGISAGCQQTWHLHSHIHKCPAGHFKFTLNVRSEGSEVHLLEASHNFDLPKNHAVNDATPPYLTTHTTSLF